MMNCWTVCHLHYLEISFFFYDICIFKLMTGKQHSGQSDLSLWSLYILHLNRNHIKWLVITYRKEILCVSVFLLPILDEDVWLSSSGANTFHCSCQTSHLLKLHEHRRFGPLYPCHSGKLSYHSSVIFYKWTPYRKDHWPEMYLLLGELVAVLTTLSHNDMHPLQMPFATSVPNLRYMA